MLNDIEYSEKSGRLLLNASIPQAVSFLNTFTSHSLRYGSLCRSAVLPDKVFYLQSPNIGQRNTPT